MLHASRRLRALSALTLVLASLAPAPGVSAQGPADNAKDDPPFREYKGVRIGMTAAEARKLLGAPAVKDDQQDFYSFNEAETCQVFYDNTKKVFAVSVSFTGDKAAPAAKAVLGDDAEARPDGSLHKRITYRKAGYWVSYTRTSGDSPMTIIAMQKIE